jgi:hypothetical protein
MSLRYMNEKAAPPRGCQIKTQNLAILPVSLTKIQIRFLL